MSLPKNAAPDMSVSHRIKALSKLLERRSSELSKTILNLPFPEASIIGIVGDFGPQTIMDISRRTNLDKSQTSRTVDALLSKAILARGKSDLDGRSVIISLTTEGKKMHKKIGPIINRRDKELFGCLSEPEEEALLYLLDKILAANTPPEAR